MTRRTVARGDHPNRLPDHVDGARLLDRLATLGAIGATADGGVTRLAYSDDDLRARDEVAGWLASAGVAHRVDAGGNLLARVEGTANLPGAITTGSHLDTVTRGGRLDGAYGVVAAVEVIATAAASPLRHDVQLVAFSNEEGARGTPGMVGSHAVAGVPLDLDARDDDGVALSDRLRFVGGDPAALATARWPADEVAAFVELHIEQAQTLESSAMDIGVVTAISGRITLDVAITGRQQHAGTTVMAARADALVPAAALIVAVDAYANAGNVRVATVGRITASPNMWNVVPGSVELTVDLRDADHERLHAAVSFVRAEAERLCSPTGCVVEVRNSSAVPPTPMSDGVAECIAVAAEQLKLRWQRTVSGAGHDAQLVARVAPTAMCFVPSRGGLSHTPDEHTSDHHLVNGANVLLRTVHLLDERLDRTDHDA